jgi:hypothetical protein
MATTELIHSIKDLLDTAAIAGKEPCPTCGVTMKYKGATFFYEGETWEIPLPFCPDCQPSRMQ